MTRDTRPFFEPQSNLRRNIAPASLTGKLSWLRQIGALGAGVTPHTDDFNVLAETGYAVVVQDLGHYRVTSAPKNQKSGGSRQLHLPGKFLDFALAEVWEALEFDGWPWPSLHTARQRAGMVLAVVARLHHLSRGAPIECYDGGPPHDVSDVQELLMQVLGVIKHFVNTWSYKRGRRIASRSWKGLQTGDTVEAHFGTVEGDRSAGTEDATVLAVSKAKNSVRIEYVDGLVAVVPSHWIVRRILDVSKMGKASVLVSTTLPGSSLLNTTTPAVSSSPSVPSDEVDSVLAQMLQRPSSAAEICFRIKNLCASNCDRVGMSNLAATLNHVLVQPAAAGVSVQAVAVEVLVDLCGGSAEDSIAARTVANALILCPIPNIACSPAHRAMIYLTRALSDAQRTKLLEKAQPTRWYGTCPEPSVIQPVPLVAPNTNSKWSTQHPRTTPRKNRSSSTPILDRSTAWAHGGASTLSSVDRGFQEGYPKLRDGNDVRGEAVVKQPWRL